MCAQRLAKTVLLRTDGASNDDVTSDVRLPRLAQDTTTSQFEHETLAGDYVGPHVAQLFTDEETDMFGRFRMLIAE